MVMYDTELDVCSVLEPFKDPVVLETDYIPFKGNKTEHQSQKIEIVGKPAKVKIEKITVGGPKKIKRKTCSNCGEQGHLAKTCRVNTSEEESGQDVIDKTPYKKTVTEEDIAKIQEMRLDGYKSHQVAEELHIHLEVVNKHWNPLV